MTRRACVGTFRGAVETKTDYFLEQILRCLLRIERRLVNEGSDVMSALDDLTAQVHAAETVGDSVVTLLKGLSEQLKAAGTDQAKLEELANELHAKSDAWAGAVVANTPAATPVPEAPPAQTP